MKIIFIILLIFSNLYSYDMNKNDLKVDISIGAEKSFLKKDNSTKYGLIYDMSFNYIIIKNLEIGMYGEIPSIGDGYILGAKINYHYNLTELSTIYIGMFNNIHTHNTKYNKDIIENGIDIGGDIKIDVNSYIGIKYKSVLFTNKNEIKRDYYPQIYFAFYF